MIKAFPPALRKLIDEFSKMPGIGVRSAQRLAFHVLQSSKENTELLVRSIKEVKENIKSCSLCNNLSEEDLCAICSDRSRDRLKICVVEEPSGILAMEKSGVYDGIYHVLLGALSPIDGVGPEELKIGEFVSRVRKENIKEVIIATDFTTEGETTALYLKEILKPLKVKVTRLARGVPVGASLEYADVATLQRAFEDRKSE